MKISGRDWRLSESVSIRRTFLVWYRLGYFDVICRENTCLFSIWPIQCSSIPILVDLIKQFQCLTFFETKLPLILGLEIIESNTVAAFLVLLLLVF